MRISIIKKNKIKNIILPSKVEGNYWISDIDRNGINRNLISIEADNGKWKLISNKEVLCIDNQKNSISSTLLEEKKFYSVKNVIENKTFLLYCSHINSKFTFYNINSYIMNGITFGRNRNTDIYSSIFEDADYYIKDNNGTIHLIDNNSKFGAYINNIRVKNNQKLKNGDIIFLVGMKLVFLYFNNNGKIDYYLGIDNNIADLSVKFEVVKNLPQNINTNFIEPTEELEYPMYDQSEYFHKVPRFIKQLETLELNIDPPPEKRDDNNSSILLTVGPMLTMSMTSLVTGYVSINSVMNGDSTWERATPSIVICVAMFASIFIWPVFSRKYEKKQRKKYEEKRQEKYNVYIAEKKMAIVKAKDEQSVLLKSLYPDTKSCVNIIISKLTTLWQRRIGDSNFLEINLGIGSSPMKINIKYPEEHFSMTDDNLKEMVYSLEKEPKNLSNVPIIFSLYKNYISAIVGDSIQIHEYTKNMLIQILAHHSYEDLKIVILTDDNDEYNWDFIKNIPHNFTNKKDFRFFATNNDDYKEICYYLNNIYESRKNDNNIDKKEFDSIYLILTDNFKKIKNLDLIDSILNEKNNLGFSLLILDEKITNLTDQCESIIQIDNSNGELVCNNDISKNIKFIYNDKLIIDYEYISKVLANIPIEFKNNDEKKLPNKLGFLEMFDVGKIEQLNTPIRWQNSNPITNLSTEVGYDHNGEKIFIDLHEKYHGPHGLIAGMTGSGKSEFIITYILSMAINYHPYEVQFILIDYKGGGLAGAFENNVTGLKLPHLIGTITNLDANEINRSLSSIESELKKRQVLFNKARELSDDSTIDIYKYQKMYRDKIISEPISHLFIICDEFAELKNQQPEFMDELISIARIGRSLGVHLILATQKPSGVVDPQIWSNTKFRVCMRVQDKEDSNEVIKCNDAAFLKHTGRFYFQVGFNEIFLLGQAAWSGSKYLPNDKVNKTIDTTIDYINNIGYSIKKIETHEKNNLQTNENGGELINIVKYLSNIAKDQNIQCKPLWLQRIPEFIKIDDLIKKYIYHKDSFIINPIIGEYDIPTQQEQKLLTLPLSKYGNALIYGNNGLDLENIIITTIYSSLLTYDPREINYYIIDSGSGSLKMFSNCPIVGDVLNDDNSDKIENLYKMIFTIIEERKNLFSDYNGEYVTYCKNSGKIVPNIVVIINNYELYQETFEKYDDTLVALSRECNRYGIFFILTLNTPNGIRFKLKQNFALTYALQQNNTDDYSSILGNVYKNYPSKIFGRGIMKNNNMIYEFQTAFATNREEIPNYIKKMCIIYCNKYSYRAKKVPELPSIVKYSNIRDIYDKTNNLIVGINKDNLELSKFNFMHNYITFISSLYLDQIDKFVDCLIKQIVLKNNNLVVINTEDINIEKNNSYSYVDDNYNDYFEKLLVNIETNNNIDQNNSNTYYIIIGLDNFKNRLNESNQIKFGQIFDKARNLKNISFIIIDSIDRIKKFEIEQWYKNNVRNNNGIWIGNGIQDQYTIRYIDRLEEMKKSIPDGFCFVIKNGKVEYVKYITEI